MTANLASDLASAIRGAAQATGACIVDDFPKHMDRAATPLVTLDQLEAVRLISAARPKAVYLVEIEFDPAEELADATEQLSGFGVDKLPSSLTAAHRRIAGHAGELRMTLVAFMVDGMMHTCSATAEWYEGFEEAVEEALEAAREDALARRRAEAKAVKAEIASKATVLAAHSSFNFGRVSFDKRLTLAEHLFQGCNESDLREITRCAENLSWLEQSGVKLRS